MRALGWSSFLDRVDDGHSYVNCMVIDVRRGEFHGRGVASFDS